MVKINWCLCSRRTDSNKAQMRVGTASVWPVFLLHIEKKGLEISNFSDLFICMKCYASIAHLRMNDRGSNNVMKNGGSIDSKSTNEHAEKDADEIL